MPAIRADGYVVVRVDDATVYAAGETAEECWEVVVGRHDYFRDGAGNRITAAAARPLFAFYLATGALVEQVHAEKGSILWATAGGIACTMAESQSFAMAVPYRSAV